MATSGKIIDILGKLQKGSEKQRGAERKSKRKEAQQHKTMYSKLMAEFEKARNIGENKRSKGGILSTILALSGAGLPFVLAANLAGKLVAGKMGRDASQAKIGDIKGFKGTKFEGDIEQYKDQVGADYVGSAIQDTLMMALSSKMLSSAGEGFGKGLGQLKKGAGTIGEKVKGLPGLKDIQMPAGVKMPKLDIKGLKDILEKGKGFVGKVDKTPLGLLAGKETGIGQELAKALGAKGGDKMTQRLIEQAYWGDKRSKQGSIYEYEIPESMSSPYFDRG